MQFTLDKFNGLIIDSLSIPENESEFNHHLTEITNFARNEKKNLIWLTLPIEKSHLVKSATNLGFVFHNCLETELTLIRKSETTTFIPFVPTHTLWAGAIVVNARDEILVIKEHRQQGYKLPGGHIELGECIESAITREVFEETGVKASFGSVVGFTAIHPSHFGRSNLYLICRLNPVSEAIEIHDLDEIADAKWMSITDYVNDTDNALFNRQMVHSLANGVGLSLVDLKYNNVPNKKQETFFIQPQT